jgi:hypothetical protein
MRVELHAAARRFKPSVTPVAYQSWYWIARQRGVGSRPHPPLQGGGTSTSAS